MGERIVLSTLFEYSRKINIAGTSKVGFYRTVVLDYTYGGLSSLAESLHLCTYM